MTIKKSKVAKGNMPIKIAADWLVEQFKKDGYIIQRYDAPKTKSIYLKLDYGVANSIRIGDHKGYKYLSYRYNVECWRDKGTGLSTGKDRRGNERKYYPSDKKSLEQLVEEIKEYKRYKLAKYGEEKYRLFMQSNINRGENARSGTFWHKAELVS